MTETPEGRDPLFRRIRQDVVHLSPGQMEYARWIARGRKNTGGPSRQPDSGHPRDRVDLVGAMAEIAVCLFYGVDYREHVTVMSRRPGAVPDLTYQGYGVSVKGRERFDAPLDMVLMEHDTKNDIYLLCSVGVVKALVQLRGYATRKMVLKYAPQEWKWTTDRPGKDRPAKRRYIPVEDLKPCKQPDREPD